MKVLFVCTGNTCRSPMAAGLLKAIAESRGLLVEVNSAGLDPFAGEQVADNAVKAMAELGINIPQECSKPITPEALEWADLVIAVQRHHAESLVKKFPQFASKVQFLEGYVRDPYEGLVERYREVRDAIKCLLLRFIDSGGLDKGQDR